MSENSTRHSSYLDDSGDNARRRAQINARRISGGPLPARANQSTADLRFEQASLIERSSRAKRDAHQTLPDEDVAMHRAATRAGSPVLDDAPEITTHRPERSAMSTPVPRGSGQRTGTTTSMPLIDAGYTEVGDRGVLPSQSGSFAPQPEAPHGRQGTPYVRKQRPRHTADAINDMEADELYARAQYQHESSITIGRTNLFSRSSRAYRSAQRHVPRLRQGHSYGRYLEVPKGRVSLFSMEQQRRQRRNILMVVALIALIALIVFLVLSFR